MTFEEEIENLRKFLSSHERDIATSEADFGILKGVFFAMFDRNPGKY
jgi:hypothetical protein